MIQLLRKTLVSVALCTVWAIATAQTTYKCGNSYSEKPCDNAIIVDNRDERTNDQKKQAEHSMNASEKMANEYAAERTEREKKEAAANRQAAAAQLANEKAKTKRTTVTLVRPFPTVKTEKLPKPPKPPKAPKPPKSTKNG